MELKLTDNVRVKADWLPALIEAAPTALKAAVISAIRADVACCTTGDDIFHAAARFELDRTGDRLNWLRRACP